MAFVHKALVYAVECHSGQYRKSGEPYIIHPIQVAGILAKLKLDAVTVACGFLHDVVEDTDATLDDLEREFGHDVRVIVDGVTSLVRSNTSLSKSSWLRIIARCLWPCQRIFALSW